jgi:HD-like signal output (HDOD) protein/CheY-like chemotaxis protein
LKRVLFVDDEPNVLQGLQRMLRSMRHEWEMSFAEGGPAALQLLAAEPFDVVVSDMRMPGMDGARLLSEIRRLHPQTVRIVLSGHSDREMIMKSVGPAHQYLSKPCESESLKETVSRACALRDLLANSNLQLLVSQMQSLPSLPSLYVELVKELELPDASTKKIGQIISRDPGMTAKILQMVNSAFFGLRRHISSPADAVSLLGLDTVRALVLSVHVFSEFDGARIPGFSIDHLWSHSMTVGTLAKKIAKIEGATEHICEAALTAGLLHETGVLVLAAKLPKEYTAMLSLAREEKLSVEDAEHRIFGAGHPEVGAYLLGLWGLPDSIVEAVAFHHEPDRCPGKEFNALAAVYVADRIDRVATPSNVEGSLTLLDPGYLAKLGVSERLPIWQRIYDEMDKG